LGGSNEEDAESVLFGNDLIAQARAENKLVPSVVTKCIEAVEEQG
jgi:Rac GTPase-activating protein 1